MPYEDVPLSNVAHTVKKQLFGIREDYGTDNYFTVHGREAAMESSYSRSTKQT